MSRCHPRALLLLLQLIIGLPSLAMANWFQGPVEGGVITDPVKSNGCLLTFVPADDHGRQALGDLRRNPINVLMIGSKFAGRGLRVSPRGSEFCLIGFNLAFDESDVQLDPRLVPRLDHSLAWALEVFKRANIAIRDPRHPNPAKANWGAIMRIVEAKYDYLQPYHPLIVKEILSSEGREIPMGLEEEIRVWPPLARRPARP